MTYNELKSIFRYLAHMIVISAVAGAAGAILVAAFSTLLDILIEATPRLLPRAPFLLPVIGALITGSLILKRVPGAGGEGIPSYIAAANKKWGHFNTATTVLKFPATLITLGFYGSGLRSDTPPRIPHTTVSWHAAWRPCSRPL